LSLLSAICGESDGPAKPQHSSPQKAQKAQNDFANTFVPFTLFRG